MSMYIAGTLLAVGLSTAVVVTTRDRTSPRPRPEPNDPIRRTDPDDPTRAGDWTGNPDVEGDARPSEAPLSLTTSDGASLRLLDLRANAVLDGPFAYTQMHLTFENPDARTREGTFRIALPEGASIGRFAMRVGDHWQEGEVIEKERARRVYEDFLHRKQDPALLEKSQGNEFSARVFPIPARGKKELIVAYSMARPSDKPFRLPLRGLPELTTVDVRVHEHGRVRAELERSAYVPTSDVEVPADTETEGAAWGAGSLAAVRVRPRASGGEVDAVDSVLVLVDTSASRALGLGRDAALLAQTLQAAEARTRKKLRVLVAAFDQTVEPVYEGDGEGFAREGQAKLVARDALGASDLGQALDWARTQKGFRRVLLVTDGVVTAGTEAADGLAEKARALGEAGVARMDAIVTGGIRDEALLAHVLRKGMERPGAMLSADLGPSTIARRLESTVLRDVRVEVDGAQFVWPKQLTGLQSGDDVLVVAAFDDFEQAVPRDDDGESARAGRREGSIRVRLSGPGVAFDRTLDRSAVGRPLLERALAKAKLEALEAEERQDGTSAALRARIVSLSTRHRVLSNYTSLLVLETQADYTRYGIDRASLRDLLTVRDGALRWQRRDAWEQRPASPPPPRKAASPTDPWASGAGRTGSGRTASADEAEAAPAPPPGAVAAAAPAPLPSPTTQAASEAKKEEADVGNLGGMRGGGAVGGRAVGGGGLGMADGIAQGAPRARAEAAHAEAPSEEGFAPPTTLGSVPAGAAHGQAAPPRPRLTPNRLPPFGEPMRDDLMADRDSVAAEPRRQEARRPPPSRGDEDGESSRAKKQTQVDPYTGPFRDVKAALRRGDVREAVSTARDWMHRARGEALAYVAFGEALEADGRLGDAGRAYGSIIDLFPSRADLRRFAGGRLLHLAEGTGLRLAQDTFEKAKRDRPDHPASHRFVAYARLRNGDHRGAFDAILEGLSRRYPSGRFESVDQILREDLGLIGAAWVAHEPDRRGEVEERIRGAGGTLESSPSLRFVLTWETDANDVDFHIEDARGGHAYYGAKELPSGGRLYADITTGYGPECFTVRAPKDRRAAPYTLRAHYYSRGPMGYGMGVLSVVDHDGRGHLTFEDRPFVVMQDHAYVDMGKVL
jgi:hypothetical protein